MMKKLVLVLLVLMVQKVVYGQKNKASYRNFPLVVGVQFHSFTMPLKDVPAHFDNVGIRVGTEVSWNEKQNWVQSFSAGWYRNKNAGDGLMVFTQTNFRPSIGPAFVELKIGAGVMKAFHPADAYTIRNGEWVKENSSGKTMLLIPAGISIGYNGNIKSKQLSPFVSYEIMPAFNYNDIVPLMPNSLFCLGSRIHL